MERMIVATKNKGKMREIRFILSALPYQILSLEEAGIFLDVEEDGASFEENALKKAQAIWAVAGGMVLADDSGLEVDALGGEPGIRSARYGGNNLDDQGRWQLLLKNLEGVPEDQRTARFVCAAAVISAKQRLVVRGTMEGHILLAPRGENGFGYDPVFFVTETGKSVAEMDEAEKNRVSHRGRSLALLASELANSHVGGMTE